MESQPSQNQPQSSLTKIMIVLSAVAIVPMAIATSLVTLYIVQGDRPPIAKSLAQPKPIETDSDPAVINGTQEMESRSHVYKLYVELEGLEPRQVDALAVERVAQVGQDSGYSYLVAPLAMLSPITNKLNGRIITRNAGRILAESPPDHAAKSPTPRRTPPLEVVRKDPTTGLVVLRSSMAMQPIQVFGELPEVTSGQKLLTSSSRSPLWAVVSRLFSGHVDATRKEITVVSVNTPVQLPTGELLSNAIETTPLSGHLGALLYNGTGQPVAMVVFAESGRTFAVPLETVFRMTDPEQLTVVKAESEADSFEDSRDRGPELGPPPTLMPDLPNVTGSEPLRIPAIESPPFVDELAAFGGSAPTRVPEPPAGESDPVIPGNTPPASHASSVPGFQPTLTDDRSEDVRSAIPKMPRQTLDLGPDSFAPEQVQRTHPSNDMVKPFGSAAVSSMDDQDITLDREARQLASRIRTTKPHEHAALVKELEQLTERHFAHRQQYRMSQINELGQRLEKLRGTQQAREANRIEIIQRRVKDLLDPKADLRWEETGQPSESESTKIKETKIELAEPSNLEVTPPVPAAGIVDTQVKAIPPVEKTFDGVPYSQWLKMLETEQKPEKLSMAMDACSRLASAGDESRIARGIFLGARPFESGDEKEQGQVWKAGWLALNRLPSAIVVDELCIAMRDRESFPNGRRFQARYLTGQCSPSVNESLQKRSKDVIGELVKLARPDGKDKNWLLAAACNIWQHTDIPLTDFEDFSPLVLQMIDRGLTVTYGGWNEEICQEWKYVVLAAIARKPAIPDLAARLMKQASKSREVVMLIGLLRRDAEPVVPALVDMFIVEWKRYEAERNDQPTAQSRRKPIGHEEQYRDHFRRVTIIEALSKIGAGQKAAVLLRDLTLIAPPRGYRDQIMQELFTAVENAVPKYVDLPIPESAPMLLGDATMISHQWKLQAMAPGKMPDNVFAQISRSYYFMLISVADRGGETHWRNVGNQTIGSRFEIDEMMPGSISIFDVEIGNDQVSRVTPGTRREGVYKLTPTSLRIQLAAVGQPRPAELVEDKSQLPAGQLLLEFVRKTAETPDRGNLKE